MRKLSKVRTATAATLLLAAFVLVATLASSASAAVESTFYVSPTGGGSACSSSSPCALATAQSQVQSMAPTMTGDLVVELAGGTYNMSSELTFGSSDSGENGHTVVYDAVPGQTPILSGGTTVSGWTLHDSSLNIYEASVPTGFNTREIYVNGVRASLAEENASDVFGTMTQTSTGYTISNTAIDSWSEPSLIDFRYPGGPAGAPNGHPWQWTDAMCGVSSVSGSSITMDEPCYANATNAGTNALSPGPEEPNVNLPIYVEDNYNLLNQPGQFFVDSTAGEMYYIPRTGENLSTATVVAGGTTTLLGSTGAVHNLEVNGLTFEYTGWEPGAANGVPDLQANDYFTGSTTPPTLTTMPCAVSFSDATNVVFENNTLEHLGACGVGFAGGGSSDSILGNVVTDAAGNGIDVGVGGLNGGPPPSTLESGYTVDDNYVYNVANQFLGGVGIWAGYVENTTIDHNEVWDVPYSGISLGWGWNEDGPTGMVNNHVDYNYVHDVMSSQMNDGGAIYVNGNEGASPASTVEGNYLNDDPQTGGAELYLDNGVSNFTVDNNVVAHVPATAWIVIQTSPPIAIDNTVEDNYTDNSVIPAFDASNTVTGNEENRTSWPSAAVSIIQAAGIESTYSGILGGPSVSNLAIGATDYSSSTISGSFTAADATDENDSDGWSPSGSDSNPWWETDLGASYNLTDVQILFRQDLDQPQSRENFEILVSNSSDFSSGYTTACTQGAHPLPFRSAYDCPIPSGPWRYVAIVSTVTGGYLFLDEVRVYGQRDSNVALGASAAASSTYSPSFSPAQAVDGNIATGWSPTGSDSSPYWEVSLAQQYTLSQVQIVTRQDIDQPQTRENFQVWVSNNDDMSFGKTVACTYTTPSLAFQSTYTCLVPPGPWQYVAVVKTDNQYFFLSEVRVFGH